MVYKAKEKLSRREGVNLFLKGARSFSDKEAIKRGRGKPGDQGRRPSRMSAYARQLREKQKVKRMFMMREKQFRRFFKDAVKYATNTRQDKGFIFLQFLERRLDSVLYRSGLARSKSAGRQLVSHRHVKLNGKWVNVPSIIVKEGDVITISEKVFEKYKPDYDIPEVPAWLKTTKNQCKVVRLPKRDEMNPEIKEFLIVELYSR